MMKWIAPLALCAAILGPAVAPAAAQDRYYDNGRQHNAQRRDDLSTRADAIRDNARRMFDNGNLSRDHMNRTIDKLDRIYSDSRNRTRIASDRYDSDQHYMDDVENTLNKWRDSDRNHFRHHH